MFQPSDIHSLTDFQRNAKDHIERLQASGRPEILTVNGKAAVVVQDAASYEKLLENLERANAIKAIRRGLDQARRGETKPAHEVLAAVRSKHKIGRA